ncbi:MAG: hypothetical protein LBT06_01200 [Hungatella sp.]|jgi:hypothetical protein|nr:hypothetical protein [Hungatella sp.]
MNFQGYYTPNITGSTSGTFNLPQWQEAERQRRLYEEFQKEQRLIQNDAVKAQKRAEIRLWELRNKEIQKESFREHQRAQYESLSISEAGEVFVETKNLQIQAQKRRICNFLSPSLVVLQKAEEEDERIYQIEFLMNQKYKYIYLLSQFADSGTYLLKKFHSVGAWIKAPNTAQEKKYARELIRFLVENHSCIQIVPVLRGWVCMKNQGYVYIKEDVLIWEDFLKKAK